ncbi:hypothetical protein PRZ48_003975 [Zasmidium cellare]|uniref:Uncharacterized protein n=1 Tax=Zasmidium cellare TaxID=395010 RepID=A0ABR0EY62_ZASCE|nr:hypothetical protein PRZ48_003975 [Zasmidium cellare]
MVNCQGLTVCLQDEKGVPFKERRPNNRQPSDYRYRLVSAAPGVKLSVSFKISRSFAWKGADTLIVAIACDNGQVVPRKSGKRIQVHAIQKCERFTRGFSYRTAVAWEGQPLERVEHSVRMPQVSDAGLEAAVPRLSSPLDTMQPAKEKRRASPAKQKPDKRARKRKIIHDSEDEDDEEILPQATMAGFKTEPQPETPAPVNREVERPGHTDAEVSKASKDTSGNSKRKRVLEMRLREIELEREAIQVQRQLLEFDD